ncbi:MAG: dihydrolipoyl dehydrogenase [Gammaproteobacteria bacterium]|nr:dihydrolipoyl dehydrogenase [Gammaproteobacteria bacterium]
MSSKMKNYDVIVIGAGPAGYVAAIRCAQLGLQTACVDNWFNKEGKPSPGGTCLNVGCIPSKALLESSELFEKAKTEFSQHGITTKNISLDLEKMIQRKEQVVNDLTSGIGALFTANQVDLISGTARLLADKEVEVSFPDKNKKEKITAENIILAPGSLPRAHPEIPFTNNLIVDSSAALEFESVPGSIAILGAGVIGLELGSVWRRLGSKVSLIELSKGFLPTADKHISQQARRILLKQGLNFHFETRVTGYEIKNNKVQLEFENSKGQQKELFDKVIVAIGRVPNIGQIFSDNAGINLDSRGFIEVNEQCQTNVDGIYAIGDAVRGPMLAHKGSEEGMMVAERIKGKSARVNYETVPFVVYTDPEIAWCGKTEQQLKESGQDYQVGSFPFASNGRARAVAQTEGMIKILADSKTDRVLGVHMLGPHVSELIAQAVIAMEFGSSSEDLAMIMFAHPSLSEVMHEAALDVEAGAIHKARPLKN